MASVAFIGLGQMGLPMAGSLLAVGHRVTGCDTRTLPLSRLEAAGGIPMTDPAQAVAGADFVITCLQDYSQVRKVWLDTPDMLRNLRRDVVLFDCSTIGVEEARTLAAGLDAAGHVWLDAPVMGDPRDARARMLSFAVGGSMAAFAEARAILEDMGERVVYVGKSGMGQAAVLCSQLMAVVNLVGAAEAFALGERLGVPPEKLFELASLSQATSSSLIERCPQSGIVPESPSNNQYQGGVSARQVLALLRLIEQSGSKFDARIPLTTVAHDLYAEYCDTKDPALDYSAIIKVLRNRG